MPVITYEGIVEGGQIRLSPDIMLPERLAVYVVVPPPPSPKECFEVTLPRGPIHLRSPRLRYPEQAADFILTVSESENGDV